MVRKTKMHWKNLASSVDIHGLQQVTNSKSKVRGMWIMMICIAAVVLVLNIVIGVDQFLNNPLLTTYSIDTEQAITFPTLYICPLNFLNKTIVNHNKFTNEKIDQMLGDYYRTFMTNADEQGKSGGLGILARKATSMQQIGERLGKSGPPIVRNGMPNSQMPDGETPYDSLVNATYENETVQEFFKRVGYTTEEFVKECSFAGKPFDCFEFVTPVFDFDYGKCFILDLKGKEQRDAGSGLSMLLDIWTEEYPEEIQRTAMFDGVVLKIGKFVDPASVDKYLLHPGKFTTLRLASKTIKSINVSIGREQQTCSGNDRALRVLNAAYSRQSCQFDCLQLALQSHCSCILPIDVYFLNNKSEKLCAASNDSQCTSLFLGSDSDVMNFTEEQVLSKKELTACLKSCHKACEMTEFSTTATTAQFPSLTYQSALYVEKPLPYYNFNFNFYNPNNEEGSESEISTTTPTTTTTTSAPYYHTRFDSYTWRDNYILVDIAFGSMHLESLEQSPSMTINMFISNLGGQLGLWIGASLFTVIQFCAFMLSCCCVGRQESQEEIEEKQIE